MLMFTHIEQAQLLVAFLGHPRISKQKRPKNRGRASVFDKIPRCFMHDVDGHLPHIVYHIGFFDVHHGTSSTYSVMTYAFVAGTLPPWLVPSQIVTGFVAGEHCWLWRYEA